MARPIRKDRVNYLRQEMLKYRNFSEHYADCIRPKKESTDSKPLEWLVGIVRSEMWLMHKKYIEGESKKAFFEDYIRIAGVHRVALDTARDAGLYDDTLQKVRFDLHNFAKYATEAKSRLKSAKYGRKTEEECPPQET